MKGIKTKEMVLLVGLLFLITGALYYYYFLTPLQDDMANIASQITEKNEQVNLIRTKEEQLEENKKILEELIQAQNEEDKDIPTGVSEPVQLVTVSRAVRELSENVIITFDTSRETYERYQKNTINLDFASNYENVIKILDTFSQSEYRNEIVTLQLEYSKDSITYYIPKSEDEEDEYDLHVTMFVVFYSFYPDGTEGPLDKQEFEEAEILGKSPFVPVYEGESGE